MNSFCNCERDGFCPRYRRDMSGRFREICQGINVDLGTAAVFREQWARETYTPRNISLTKPISLILKTDQAPGDAVAMTAAIYSLHQAHPGRYLTAVDSLYPEVFEHNYDVLPTTSLSNALPLQMHYSAIHHSNERGIHFMQGFTEHLSRALDISVPLLTNRPHLYFDDVAPLPPLAADRFWLVCSGGKRDFTNKLWGQHNYQEVVNRLKGRVNFIQVGRLEDDHPRLTGTEDIRGTTLRGLFNLVRRCSGVLCGVSLLMHVAAALEKPAVIIAGGREPVAWNAYPKQHYLHTVGVLPCRSVQGHIGQACWRSRVVPLGDNVTLDKDLCERPVNGTPTKLSKQVMPECMTRIKPSVVTSLILMYNEA